MRRTTTDYAANTDKFVAGIGDAGSKAIDLSFWISVPSVVSVVVRFHYNWCPLLDCCGTKPKVPSNLGRNFRELRSAVSGEEAKRWNAKESQKISIDFICEE